MSLFGDYGEGFECCEGKVDPISLLVTIAAIAAVSWFLRQAVIDNMIMMARKRRKREEVLRQNTRLIEGTGSPCCRFF